MKSQPYDVDQFVVDEWRKLGFYYDFDDRVSVNQWRFYGSREGLQHFVTLLDHYTANVNNAKLFEHDHYGPYCYLKIITLEDETCITSRAIGGSIADLRHLRNIIAEKLNKLHPGDTFNIDKEFGSNNEATAKFFVMSDGFDPVSMDELIVSGRQQIVNKDTDRRHRFSFAVWRLKRCIPWVTTRILEKAHVSRRRTLR
jgi:hypothetical protein